MFLINFEVTLVFIKLELINKNETLVIIKKQIY